MRGRWAGEGRRGAARAVRRRVLLSLAVAALLLFLPARPAAAREFTLFDKVQGAELVVIGRVESAKFVARVRVEEVLKGEWTKERMEVHFRGRNYERQKWGEEKIQFLQGDQVLLFLAVRGEKERQKGEFILFPEDPRGAALLHDEEEAQLYRAAVRYCLEIDAGTREKLGAAWQEMARQANVYLRLSGLECLDNAGLLNLETLPLLAALFADRYPAVRGRALDLTQGIAERRGRTLQGTPEKEILYQEVSRLLGDEDREVRVAALRAMQLLGDRRILPRLRELAAGDPSQDVRYEAARVILQQEEEWQREGPAAAPAAGGTGGENGGEAQEPAGGVGKGAGGGAPPAGEGSDPPAGGGAEDSP